MTISLSEKAFRRGVNDALSLKPLRKAALNVMQGRSGVTEERSDEKPSRHSVTVVKKNNHWHVKQAS